MKKLLTSRELAAELGVPERTIATWRQRRLVPYVDAGHRSKFFQLDAVLRALEKRTIKPRSLRNGESA